MARPGDLILVHMVEPQAVGSYFDRHRWPLHITLLPWFGARREQHSELFQALEQVALLQVPVAVTVAGQDMFGPGKTIPVHLFAEPELLRPLHQALYDTVRLLQLPLQDVTHAGEAFTPHISQYEDRHVHAGQRVIVSDFYLVQLFEPGMCQIVQRFELKGQT